MRKQLLIFCGLVVLAGTPALADSPSCIRRNDIREWASPGNRSLVLDAGGHRVLLRLTSGCSGFGVYDKLAISGPAESDISCVAAGDTVSTSYAGEPGRCRVISVAPYRGEMPSRRSHM